jgi:hypothetical protein
MTMITEADLVWMTLIDKRMEFNLRWARERRQNAIDENRRPGNDAPIDFRQALAFDDLGLIGEAAAMIYLSPCYWHFFKTGDVRALPDIVDLGTRGKHLSVDVKTRSRHHYDLIIQLHESTAWVYVLATAPEPPIVCLRGWCWGREAMTADYRGTTAPVRAPDAYWIGQGASILRPMRELREYLHGRGAR